MIPCCTTNGSIVAYGVCAVVHARESGPILKGLKLQYFSQNSQLMLTCWFKVLKNICFSDEKSDLFAVVS